jgi:hypothetical protein
MFYKSLSEHFNNSVPKFHFTLQKGSSGEGKYYHFEVKENREDDQVNFNIKPYAIQGEHEAIERFQSKLSEFKTKMKQDGGKKKSKSKSKSKKKNDDDSDDSDLDELDELDELDDSPVNIYKRAKSYLPTQPIYYWWYDPYLYRIDSIYIPTFYSYVTPYIELSLKL